jgi:uncharacterized protein YutE (UPF0331/DUF86 family)
MTMDRGDAYRRKLSVILEELASVPDDLADLSPLEVRGVLHAVQVAIHAAVDIAAMKVKDLGEEVGDDFHNLMVLVERKVITAQMGDGLRRLNGLRNAIVHRYKRFEEEAVLDGIAEIRDILYGYVEALGGA